MLYMSRRKAACSLSRTASAVGARLELDLDRVDQPDAGGGVDHAAQLLQLADGHEDEAGVVFAHLALVEVDDREVVADDSFGGWPAVGKVSFTSSPGRTRNLSSPSDVR